MSKIQNKRSTVPGKIPTVGQMDYGELAVNVNDGKIYFLQTSSLYERIVPVVVIGAQNSGSLEHTGSLNVSGSGYFVENVGIGTSSPADKLTIENNDSGQVKMQINHNDSGRWASLGVGSSLSFFQYDSDFAIRKGTGGYGQIFFKTTGEVGIGNAIVNSNFSGSHIFIGSTGIIGIGTITPESNAKLNVSGGAALFESQGTGLGSNYHNVDVAIKKNNTQATRLLIENQLGSGYASAYTIFKTDATNRGAGNFILNTDGEDNWYVGTSYKDSATFIIAHTESATFQESTATKGNAKLLVDSSGNVGIGNTNPPEKLTVEGNISASGNLIVVGSTKFGNTLTDRHQFTGSIEQTGSGGTNIFRDNVQITGSISISGTYYGDGSNLTGIVTSGSVESASYAPVEPAFSESVEGRITTLESSPGGSGLWTGSADFISRNGNVQISGSLTASGSDHKFIGNVSSSGAISASTYYGDGSNLTGISAGGTIKSTLPIVLQNTVSDQVISNIYVPDNLIYNGVKYSLSTGSCDVIVTISGSDYSTGSIEGNAGWGTLTALSSSVNEGDDINVTVTGSLSADTLTLNLLFTKTL